MITSSHNPRLQLARALLKRRSEREQAGLFVIEGVRLAEEALAAEWSANLVLFSQSLSDRGRTLLEGFRAAGAEVEEVTPNLLDAVADTDTTQGILAVLPARRLPLPADLSFIVIADAIRDPGNLGTLLRTAAAAGVQAVLCAPGTVDAFAPKVLRAGMGAHFRVPVQELNWDEIRAVCKDRPESSALNLIIAEAAQGAPLWLQNFRTPLALIVGGEAEGASPAARQIADSLVTIPMPGKSESLNAAVAASILLFEVVRQRSGWSQS